MASHCQIGPQILTLITLRVRRVTRRAYSILAPRSLTHYPGGRPSFSHIHPASQPASHHLSIFTSGNQCPVICFPDYYTYILFPEIHVFQDGGGALAGMVVVVVVVALSFD